MLLRLVRENPLRAENAWKAEEIRNPYLNLADERVELIERICVGVIEELKRQSLTSRNDDFLEAHTYELMERIKDPELHMCHVLEG